MKEGIGLPMVTGECTILVQLPEMFSTTMPLSGNSWSLFFDF